MYIFECSTVLLKESSPHNRRMNETLQFTFIDILQIGSMFRDIRFKGIGAVFFLQVTHCLAVGTA